MATLTRATLGKRSERATKVIEIDGDQVRIQKPTPLEFSQYQLSIIDKSGEFDVYKAPAAILLLVARMWIDDDGKRLFGDNETKELGEIDLGFYQRLSEECQEFANGREDAKKMLGESAEAPSSSSPEGSA